MWSKKPTSHTDQGSLLFRHEYSAMGLPHNARQRPRVISILQPTREYSRVGHFRLILTGRWRRGWLADAQASMLLAEASSAICVQRFDDSRNSAIHTTYRISLRSSSLREPRYPLLRVVLGLLMLQQSEGQLAKHAHTLQQIQTYF